MMAKAVRVMVIIPVRALLVSEQKIIQISTRKIAQNVFIIKNKRKKNHFIYTFLLKMGIQLSTNIHRENQGMPQANTNEAREQK
jgi:hypothetical protein